MVGISRIISGGVLLLLVCGCSSRFNFAGKWAGKREVKLVAGSDPSLKTTLEKVSVTISDSGKYVLIDSGMPTEGNLEYVDNGAAMNPTMIMGKPAGRLKADVAKQFNGSLNPKSDGTLEFTSGQGGPAILTRAK